MLLLSRERAANLLNAKLQALSCQRGVVKRDAVALNWVGLASQSRRNCINRFSSRAAVETRQVSAQLNQAVSFLSKFVNAGASIFQRSAQLCRQLVIGIG